MVNILGSIPTTIDEPSTFKYFAYEHLPPHLAVVSKRFYEVAKEIIDTIEPGPERTEALRKLLEAKDCAVRASLVPGG